MPIYMDVHTLPGIKARDVAEAHRKDILLQKEHGCTCMTYWIDEERESIFCLIEAPAKEAVIAMHNRAHGLIPSKIIEVNSGLVSSFLGRIYDPIEAEISSDGLKIFSDPSFRILLVTKITDPILLQYKSGIEQAKGLLEQHDQIIRRNICQYEGSEAEHAGAGFITSFLSAAKAVSCALAIQKDMLSIKSDLGFTMGINAGVPVAKTNRLFGDTIQFAGYLCSIAKSSQIAIASAVRELVSRDHFQNDGNSFLTLSPQDESLLESLFSKLEENYQNPDFDITDYCQTMAMSKSQLYRKTIALTGLSPNLLLKDFRLEKAMELMKKKRDSISEITFDAGFTSPSYFTKCFKKKYGLLPMTYMDLLH
ncbi:MAG TPA: nickel-binding protein [Flavitalea sp.]|nr:nickel-binding protein [Flavitalea sp.]